MFIVCYKRAMSKVYKRLTKRLQNPRLMEIRTIVVQCFTPCVLVVRFFLNKAKVLPFSLIKKKVCEIHTAHVAQTLTNYSRGITLFKCLAPAMAQNDASSLIRLTITATGAALFLKTRAFLFFRISHPTRWIRDERAFL